MHASLPLSLSEPSRSSNAARSHHGINSIGVTVDGQMARRPGKARRKSPHALTPFATASVHHAGDLRQTHPLEDAHRG
eukprot:2100747-Prymnesium_polylepis.1